MSVAAARRFGNLVLGVFIVAMIVLQQPRHQLAAVLASGRTGGRVEIRVSLAAPDRAPLAAIAGRVTPVESETCEEHERECRHEGCGQRADRGKRDKAANEEACGQTL